MEAKTNAMRILDKAGIPYELQTYSPDDGIDGVSVARKLGQPVEQVYKTLVTKGRGGHFVFVIPVAAELDLKAAARAVDEKAVELIPVKDINKVTGYIRGGWQPGGDEEALPHRPGRIRPRPARLLRQRGRIGVQMRVNPAALASFIGAAFAPITMP